MDVRLPDGTIIRNVPKGTTRAQLTARLKRNGYDVSSLLDEEEERTFGGYAKEAFKGLIPGAVSGIETAIAGAASVLPEEAEQAVRRKVSEVAEPIRETFAPAPGYEDTVVRELSEAVGSTAPFIGAGLLGKLAATGLAAATGAGQARQRAEQEDVTEEERAAATALGIGPGLIEAVPPLRILRRFGFGKEAIEEVAGLAPSLRRIAAAGGEEALQEASSQVLQNLIAKGVYKPEEEVFGGVAEAAGLGGGAGAIIGAIAELALGRRLRGTEPPPEEQEEGITEEPTPPVTPATGAEAARRARIAPSEQMELPLDTEAVQIPMFGEEEAAAPTPSLYRPAEDALSDLKPRSRAYKEEARSLGLKLDRKGNVKPNQFVFEQPETEVPITQGRFEFEVPQEQPDLPMYVPPTEGQMDMFGTPMPRGGEMPTVPTAAEMPVVEEVPEEQYALNLPGIPMERLTPRDRVLRAMAITEDKKNIPNLRFATELRPMELQKTLGDLKKENAIKFNKQTNEWELTPEGAERVRTPRKKIGSARFGRRADVSVPSSGTPPPSTAETGESGVAGAGAPPSQSDVGEGAGEPALTRPDRISERIIFSNAGSDFVKDLYSANPVDAVLTNFEELDTVTPEEIKQSREYIRSISQKALRNEFGDEVTLYRGLKGTEERSPVLSYTLDKNVARFQAEQQGIRTGKIEEIKVPVSEVLSYSEAIGRGTFAEAEVIIPNPAYRMAIIRRAQEKRVAEDAVKQVANRRTDLRTQAIDAFEKNAINEATYNNILEELKKPVPNFGLVNDKLAARAKVEPVAAKPTPAPAPQAPALGLREDATDEEIAAFYKKTGGSKAPPSVKKERGISLAGIDREAESAADEFLRTAAPTQIFESIEPESKAPEWVSQKVWDLHNKSIKADQAESGQIATTSPRRVLSRNATMASRRLMDAVGEYLRVADRKTPEGQQQVIDFMVRLNEESGKREKEVGVKPDIFKSIESLNRPLPAVTEQLGRDRAPSLRRELGKAVKQFDADKMSGAELANRASMLLLQTQKDRVVKPRQRGAEFIRERLFNASRNGYLDPQGVELASWFIQQNPVLVEDLGVSIRQQPEAMEGTAAFYNPANRIITLFKDKGDSETATHEILHHTERLMPANIRAGILKAYVKQLTSAIKSSKSLEEKNALKALLDHHLTDLKPADYDSIIADMKSGKLSPDLYQFVNPSEFWAINGSRIVQGRFDLPSGVVGQIRKWLREFIQKVKNVFGLKSDAAIIRALDSLAKADGKYKTEQLLTEAPAYQQIETPKAQSPDERIKADRALVNSVGSSQNRLPEPTARIKEGARTAASMVPRWLRRGVFSFESTHQLADMYRPYTDKLDELWDLQNRDGAALRLKTDKIHDNLKKWHKVMDKFPPAARERIYNLFLDTTVDQIEVLDSAADPVLRDNAAVKNMKVVMKPNTEHSLYKQFSQLPQPVRDLYRDLRLAYLEDANEMEQLLSQYITPSEWQKLQMEFNKKRLAVYLPLFRSGEYKLVYTDKDGETVSRQFETSEEREKAFREVRSSGIPESKIVRKMASEFAASDIPPAGFYGKVVAKLRENDVDEKTIAKLFDLYMDYMPATSVLQLRRKRKKTPGYESDVLRAYASVGGAYARRLVNMRFMPQINKAFEDLRADLGQGSFWISYKDSKGRTVRNGYDTDELRRMAVRQAIEDGADRNSVKYFSLSDEEAADIEDIVQGQIDFFNNPKLDNYASKAAYFSFTMYMGGNVSSAIIDLTHIPMVVYSLLGSKYGFGRAAASMQRAHRYYMNPKKKLPAEIAELPSVMKRATEDGILGEQRIMDLAEFNNRFGDFGSKALEVKARVDRAMGSIFAMSDRYNRGLTFISAYELAKNQLQKKGLKGDELLEAAYTDAKRAVYDSYGSSFPKAGPSIMQNGLARLALTFKRFALNRMWLLFKALDQATRGESKEVKNIARAQLLGFYGMAYVFSGAQGLPFMGAFQLLASIFNGMFGDDDELYDIQDATRQAVGMFNYRGPINYLLGVDIASRSGWDQMLWRDDPRRIAEVGPATYAMEQLLGPAFSYAVNAPRAFEHFSEGRFSQGMETLTPRVIANLFKSFRYGTEGALTKDNIPVVDDISKYNQFMQLLGFAPTEVGEAYQQAGVAKKFEREINDRRDGLIRRAMMAIVSEDDEGRTDALKEIIKFNEKHPGKPITDESISRSVTNHYIKLNQSVNGVRVDPKLAQEIYDRLGYDTEDTLDESTLEEQEDLATDLLYE